jgi:hypothetical protein
MIFANIDYIITIALIALIVLSMLIDLLKYIFYSNDSAIVVDSAIIADDAVSAYSDYRERKLNYE